MFIKLQFPIENRGNFYTICGSRAPWCWFQNFLLTFFFGNYGVSSIWTIMLEPHFKVLTPYCRILTSPLVIKQKSRLYSFFLKQIFFNKLATEHLRQVIYQGMATWRCTTGSHVCTVYLMRGVIFRMN